MGTAVFHEVQKTLHAIETIGWGQENEESNPGWPVPHSPKAASPIFSEKVPDQSRPSGRKRICGNRSRVFEGLHASIGWKERQESMVAGVGFHTDLRGRDCFWSDQKSNADLSAHYQRRPESRGLKGLSRGIVSTR
jgi:hypothetical protein